MQNPAGFAPTLEIAARFPHCHPPTTARLVQYKIKKGAFLSHTLRLPSGSFFNWKRLRPRIARMDTDQKKANRGFRGYTRIRRRKAKSNHGFTRIARIGIRLLLKEQVP